MREKLRLTPYNVGTVVCWAYVVGLALLFGGLGVVYLRMVVVG